MPGPRVSRRPDRARPRAGGASRGMHRRATRTALTVRRSRLEVEASDRGSQRLERAQAESGGPLIDWPALLSADGPWP